MKTYRHDYNAIWRNPWMYLTMLGILIALACAGCANTGKFIATTSTTVDSAMQGWAIWVADGHATPQARQQVSLALDRYHLAEDVALQAYLQSTKTGDRKAWMIARDALTAAQADLLALIASVQHKGQP